MTERWKIAIGSGLTVGAVFIDFRKAFDTVPHDILSYKLHAIGISGSLHEWQPASRLTCRHGKREPACLQVSLLAG